MLVRGSKICGEKEMNIFVRFIFRLLPDKFVEELNAVSLD
jgi:hypothetical protein